MEKINISYINKINNFEKKCPRCKGLLFFDIVASIKDSVIEYGIMTRCCGSDFIELREDWGLEV